MTISVRGHCTDSVHEVRAHEPKMYAILIGATFQKSG